MEAYPDTIFYNIDAMNFDNRDLIKELGIRAVPSFKIFVHGDEIAEVKGEDHFDEVETAIQTASDLYLPNDEDVETDTFNVIDDTTEATSEEDAEAQADAEAEAEVQAEPTTLAQAFAKRMGIQQHLAALF